MTRYDFNKVFDAKTFENFGKDILEVRENLKFEIFSEGRDNGIDIRYVDSEDYIICQVKKYRDYNSLYHQLKNIELEKVKKLNPKRYILIVSTSLNPTRKDKIQKLFSKYILTPSDIIGEAEINNYLGQEQYSKIEKAYPQLWINSSNVLKSIIEKELNSDIYEETKIIIREMQESSCTFVKNDVYQKALKKLIKNKCLLICGEPGTGKTTLAYNLTIDILKENSDMKFLFLRDINYFFRVFREEKTQIFLMDDFWGNKYISDTKDCSVLQRIIKIIEKSNNKFLILTSRDYILEQGYADYPELEDFFDKYKLKMTEDDLTDYFKESVLIRHLENANLEYSAIVQILGGYKYIINNPNYSPRIIENYINYLNNTENEIHNYLQELIEYMENPHKMWKDIFSKQTEGSQLIAILMLLFDKELKLNELEKIFYNCIDNNIRINARKKDFKNYISQLENTIIYTYTEVLDDSHDILVRFKNSSIELYLYSFFNENIEEYFDTIIKATKCLNVLVNLLNCNKVEIKRTKIDYRFFNTNKQKYEDKHNAIIDKIINEFDDLYYLRSEFDYRFFDKDCKSLRLIIIAKVYEKTNETKLWKFIYDKTKDFLNSFYKDDEYDLIELGYIPNIIQINLKLKIYQDFDVNRILNRYWILIRFSEFLIIFSHFKKIFEKEYVAFISDKNMESEIINLTISDAEYFMDAVLFKEDGASEALEDLTEFVIPYLFEEYNIKPKRWYMDEIYDITENVLPFDKKNLREEKKNIHVDLNESNEIEVEELNEKDRIFQLRIMQLLKDRRKEITEEEAKTYLKNFLVDKSIYKKISDEMNSNKLKYLDEFLESYNKIEFIVDVFNMFENVDYATIDLFEKIILYLKKNYISINEETIHKLLFLSYNSFCHGRKSIYESELIEEFKVIEIEELLNSKLLYCYGKKYYLITNNIHLYFAICYMINNKKKMEDVFYIEYDEVEFSIWGGHENTIFNILSDIDTEVFNTSIILPQLKSILEIITSNSKKNIVKKMVEWLNLKIEFEIEENDYYDLCISEIADEKRLVLNYLGLDVCDLIEGDMKAKEIIDLLKKHYPKNKENKYEIDICNSCEEDYNFLKELGFLERVYNFYKFIRDYAKIIERK